ncbi:adenylate kinase family enzyme [Lewinella antarctica]|uniref:Adenylate kinase family enzyme n=1 Tax=Neolewinella antarctica TaxID=442734 RepID=A0ABX0XDS8_9BACT|nr:adenylate kinase family enzyme [Neolewinella antarctica]
MDGNYGGSLDVRLVKADTIIYLNYPTVVCLWRITKRTFRYFGKTRPGIPKGYKERFDLNFFHYVATNNSERRESSLNKLSGLAEKKEIITIRNDEEVDFF